MEWVETTGKTVDVAREAALDQLGVGVDDAEFDILEEPKPGLFGRVRGEARVRARIRPTQARPKQERRRRSSKSAAASTPLEPVSVDDDEPTDQPTDQSTEQRAKSTGKHASTMTDTPAQGTSTPSAPTPSASGTPGGENFGRNNGERERSDIAPVSPQEVGDAAVAFMSGLTDAFGMTATSDLLVDGTVLELKVHGTELGLLVGPGGRTLSAVQDLARVAAQRRLGDHETRLRIDVAGYRERREVALATFARQVAEQVRSSGVARSLEPMTSSDRKVVHDVLNDEAGVVSRSVGEDPDRRIIVEPDSSPVA